MLNISIVEPIVVNIGELDVDLFRWTSQNYVLVLYLLFSYIICWLSLSKEECIIYLLNNPQLGLIVPLQKVS